MMNVFSYFSYFSLFLVMLAVVMCFIRMLIGPSLADRVLALDLTANILISIIAIYSVIMDASVYIDVVISLALIIFLTTVAFAKILSWHATRREHRIMGEIK